MSLNRGRCYGGLPPLAVADLKYGALTEPFGLIAFEALGEINGSPRNTAEDSLG